VAKSSAVPMALRERGFRGVLSHLNSVFFGDARFNRSASTVDMRSAHLNFPKTLNILLSQTFPTTNIKKIDLFLNEAKAQIKKHSPASQTISTFPGQWDSGVELQILLYSIIRLTRPDVVVETGTANGKSTAAICAALSKNKSGHLWSFDVLDTTAPLVSDKHRKFLTLVKIDGKSSSLKKEIAKLKSKKGFSVFLHDSDHSYPNQISDYEIALSRGFDLILSDDIDASLAFCDFANSAGSVFLDAPKFIGLVSSFSIHEKRSG
jgi:predicted O-methyltransferase YrrM